ncbi:MAG: LiaF transmembrane domain-containing protein, partial [Bryobacteraceae bacterium]
MRRGSVVGPLILIGIGVLFLLRNVWPDIPVVDLMAHYWPYLLIVWGGLRLLEILVWTATSKPLPRQGVSGGEWVLVIFVCLFGAGLYTAHNYSGWWPGRGPLRGLVIDMGETYDYELGPAQQSSGKSP